MYKDWRLEKLCENYRTAFEMMDYLSIARKENYGTTILYIMREITHHISIYHVAGYVRTKSL